MNECVEKKTLFVGELSAVLYGERADRLWLFVHGQGGCREEAEAFAKIVCPKGAQVLAADLPEHGARKEEPGFDPWHAVPELRQLMAYAQQDWAHISLRANSIGAWFSMQAFSDLPPERALLVSPLLDMERLIRGMMQAANVSEERLRREQNIPVPFGQTLSWDYLQYAVTNPIIRWSTPTAVLYAGRDNITSRSTVDAFVRRFGCDLTVMEDGEHWFHTTEQLDVLKRWEEEHT